MIKPPDRIAADRSDTPKKIYKPRLNHKDNYTSLKTQKPVAHQDSKVVGVYGT